MSQYQNRKASEAKTASSRAGVILRVLAVLLFIFLFIPEMNPAAIFVPEETEHIIEINPDTGETETYYTADNSIQRADLPLITAALSKERLTGGLAAYEEKGIIRGSDTLLYRAGACVSLIAVIALCAGAALTPGDHRFTRKGYTTCLIAGVLLTAGTVMIFAASRGFASASSSSADGAAQKLSSALRSVTAGMAVFAALGLAAAALSLVCLLRKAGKNAAQNTRVPEKYRLFLMLLPVLALLFVFCVLPFWAWRYSLYSLQAGDLALSANKFSGIRNFITVFRDDPDTVNVLRNTLIISGLGLATSWVPLLFAVLLSLIRPSAFRRGVKLGAVLPGMFSWVVVFAAMQTLMGESGLINRIEQVITGTNPHTAWLEKDASFTWVRMLLFDLWKNMGLTGLVYIAMLARRDPELMDAARTDGAGVWECIRHVTLPALLPVYLLMVLACIATVLATGADQFLLFRNYANTDYMQVLDLKIYNSGIARENADIPLTMVLSLFRSAVGLVLLLLINRVSITVRGERLL